MVHRYFGKGFTTLIFKSEEHFNECKEMYDSNFKGLSAKEIDEWVKENGEPDVFNGVRYMTQSELEKCQTVPNGYTNCLTRNEAADVLGDGWTIDVISHIFSFLKDDEIELNW